jgi:selenocysteine lyase/cysteine desulfurase
MLVAADRVSPEKHVCCPEDKYHGSVADALLACVFCHMFCPCLQVASQWVEVPLGSVRASLGYMSTWEDCYALVQFIESNYKDRSQ